MGFEAAPGDPFGPSSITNVSPVQRGEGCSVPDKVSRTLYQRLRKIPLQSLFPEVPPVPE